MNLQLRSMWDRICTTMHMHGKVKSKILVISISRHTTIGSDLIKVGVGGGDTFRHLYTYKKKKKINTNFAFMHEKAKDEQGELRELMKRVLYYIEYAVWGRTNKVSQKSFTMAVSKKKSKKKHIQEEYPQRKTKRNHQNKTFQILPNRKFSK